MSRTLSLTALVALCILSTVALAKAPDNSRAFLKAAASGGAAEVREAEIALKRASNLDITDFAKRMIDDHTKANDAVMAFAKARSLKLDTDPTPGQKAEEKRLRKLNDMGRAFDRTYLDLAIKHHRKTIALFEKQAKMGSDSAVAAFAATTLPTLKMHLEMATNLAAKLDLKSNNN